MKKRKALSKQQIDFFTLLFEGMAGAIGFQKRNGRQFFTKIDEIGKAANFLSDKQADIYVAPFTFSTHKISNASALHSRAIFLDFDDNFDIEDIDTLITEAELPSPNMIIWTGSSSSWHVYWVAETPSSNIHLFLPTLAKKMGADTKSTNKGRVLRIPGTINQKTLDKNKAHIVHFEQNRYETEELYEIFNNYLDMHLQPSYVSKIREKGKVRAINGSNKKDIFDFVSSSVIRENHRNYAIGVFVQYLGYQERSFTGILEFVRKVNSNNFIPKCTDSELASMVKGWHGRYDRNHLFCLTEGYVRKKLKLLEEIDKVKVVTERQKLVIPASILLKNSKDLNGNELYLMFIVRRFGYMTITQLADYVHLSRRTVFTCINKLKKLGIILNDKDGLRINEHHQTKQYISIDLLAIKMFEKKNVSSSEFKVMCILKLFNNLNKVTQTQLVKACGITDKRFLIRLLKKLEDNELISVEVIKRVNLYRLHF